MTTAELIAQLKHCDPEGNLLVNINGEAPFFVQTHPAYYDGNLFYIEKTKYLNCYNVKGAGFIRTGLKVVIETISLRDVLIEDINLPITYEGFSEKDKERIGNHVQKIKEEISPYARKEV